MNTRAIKKLTDEEILLLHIEYDYLLELERILASKEDINHSLKTREVIKINNENADLEALEKQNFFAVDGEPVGETPNNITIDHRALTNRELSLRERIIFDGINMQAGTSVDKNYALAFRHADTQGGMYAFLGATYMREADKMATVAVTRQRARNNPVQELGILRMQAPNSYTLSADSKKKIQDLKRDYELKFLLNRIVTLKADYKKLGRSSHNEKIDKLINEINRINAEEINTEDKIKKIIAAVEVQFKERMNAINRFSMLRSETKPEAFIDLLSRNSNDYQFPRLLAVLLKNSYRDNANLGDPNLRKLLNTFSMTNSQQRDVYQDKIADTTNDYNYPTFLATLKKTGLSNQQIFDLYNKQTTLTVDLLKQLWPHLSIAGIDDATLHKLIINREDHGFSLLIENIIDGIDETRLKKMARAESMHTTLDEMSGKSGRISMEERKQLHANIDSKFSKAGLKDQLIAIKETLYLLEQRNKILTPHIIVQARP